MHVGALSLLRRLRRRRPFCGRAKFLHCFSHAFCTARPIERPPRIVAMATTQAHSAASARVAAVFRGWLQNPARQHQRGESPLLALKSRLSDYDGICELRRLPPARRIGRARAAGLVLLQTRHHGDANLAPRARRRLATVLGGREAMSAFTLELQKVHPLGKGRRLKLGN